MNKHELEVSAATESDLIKWSNLGVTRLARALFTGLNILISLLIVIFTTYAVVLFNYQQKSIQEKSNMNSIAVNHEITIEEAYQDSKAASGLKLGLMQSFCNQQKAKGVDLGSIKFPDGQLHCQQLEAENVKLFFLSIGLAVLIATLNPTACKIL